MTSPMLIPTVLLVEDDDLDAELIRRLLFQAGLERKDLDVRSNLHDAIEALNHGKYDVVLLDLGLPDSHGVDSVRGVVEACPDVPLVVLTGNDDLSNSAEAIRSGAEDYLIKGEASHGDLLLRTLHYAIERRRARDELSRLESHLLKAQRLESLEALAGGVAHDFNNLLVGILGNASMMLADLAESSELRPLVSEIERSALVAADLTKQMLAYAGKGRFVVNVMDLSELVTETRGLLEASVSANASLRFDVSSEPLPARIDATQIRQILMNLVTNASEALEGGRGTITVTTGHTLVNRDYVHALEYNQAARNGAYGFVEVTDTGIGMDADVRARIFDPFYSTKFTGRGLGLAASLGIARGHEGAIRVYSEPGQGTSFKLLLPLAAAKASVAPTEPQAAPSESRQILVVDDNEGARQVARRILMRAGFDVTTASDGVEALSIYTTHRSEIDLVLLDMTMPRLDGEEACRRLRLADPEVKVIMMSGYNEQEITRRLAGRGAAGFLQKPYQPQALIDRVRAVLGPSNGTDPGANGGNC